MEQTGLTFLPRFRGTGAKARAAERPADLSADAEVFWELAGPFKKKLYNFINKALSFSDQADDVFQETVLRGLKYFGSYEKDKDFGTWLFTIAHNEVKRHFKNTRGVSAWPLEERLVLRDEHVRRDRIREVYRFADRLNPKHREVFFLFYDSGFSITEISRITGVREGNVKFMLNWARNSLRKSFGEQNGKL
jgi:RNA polymerase sigma-70 factor (ECF subfamily)